MDWTSIAADPEKIEISEEAVRQIERHGVTLFALDSASIAVSKAASHWRYYFPGGLTDALWFISEVSDASMAQAFVDTKAQDLSQVISIRFQQNTELKKFVRRVMLYDFCHPTQAIARMQRTARIMYACTGTIEAPNRARVLGLNLYYTLLVMVWLIDTRMTKRLNDFLVGILASRDKLDPKN